MKEKALNLVQSFIEEMESGYHSDLDSAENYLCGMLRMIAELDIITYGECLKRVSVVRKYIENKKKGRHAGL